MIISPVDAPLFADPGHGLDARVGLLSMRERVTQVGGTLAVESAPGYSDTISL